MSGFSETISDILSRLAEMLGLKKSEAARFEEMGHKLGEAKADNNDRLGSLKDEIRVLTTRARKKGQEFEEAHGDVRKIISGEIERTFRELDQLQKREKIIGANLDRIATTQAKLLELQDAQAQGVEQDDLDDLALELQDAFSELKVADRVTRDLEQVEYEPEERQAVESEPQVTEPPGQREIQPQLPSDLEKRLAELEPAQDESVQSEVDDTTTDDKNDGEKISETESPEAGE